MQSKVDLAKSMVHMMAFRSESKSVYSFQEEVDDFIILSTVRSNRRGVVRFVAATFSDSRANGET
jgi:hypothetical protein